MVCGNHTHIPCDARVGALVDGDGAGPVSGTLGNDVAIHQLKVFTDGAQLQQITQTLIFTLVGVRLSGVTFHLRDLRLQRLVFRSQCFVLEHVAVELLRGAGQRPQTVAERCQKAVNQHIGQGMARGVAQDHQTGAEQNRNDQHNSESGTE